MSRSNQTASLFGWLFLTFLAAAAGALASIDAAAFYLQLSRPVWAPPAWLFGPAWSVLYSMMAFSVWLVWKSQHRQGVRGAVILYVIQLVANAMWSWLFFALRMGAAAFYEAVLLWCLIAATLWLFNRVSRLAAVLLLPYLAWVSFAVALTFSVWQRNPTLLG